jgi:hypothetical protein
MSDEQIPQDVMEAARRAYGLIESFGWNVSWYGKNPIPDDAWPIDIIARAILAERERCANIAANWRESQPPMVVPSKQYRLHDVADEIAHAIRNPSPAADPSRAANSSPAALDAASNSNFATVPHEGIVR